MTGFRPRFQAGGDKSECKHDCRPLPRLRTGVSGTLSKPLSSLWPDASSASGADSEEATRWPPLWADFCHLGVYPECLPARGQHASMLFTILKRHRHGATLGTVAPVCAAVWRRSAKTFSARHVSSASRSRSQVLSTADGGYEACWQARPGGGCGALPPHPHHPHQPQHRGSGEGCGRFHARPQCGCNSSCTPGACSHMREQRQVCIALKEHVLTPRSVGRPDPWR
jgi:hypothetical protein